MFKRLKAIIRQYKIFIFLAALIPVLGFSLFLRSAKKPPADPVFGPLPVPETEFDIESGPEISYQFSLPKNALEKLPRQLAVYQIKKLSDQEVINRFAKLAEEMGFSTKPTIQAVDKETYYIWEEKDKFLRVNSLTGQFIFQGNLPLTLGIITPQDAESLVREKLANWGILDKDAPVTIKYFGVAGMELVPVTNPSLADVYEAVFSFSIDGFPVVGLGPAQTVAMARINREGQLLTLYYFLRQSDQEKVGTYPLKPGSLALTEVQQGQGKILSLKTKSGFETNFNPENPIKAVNINSIELIYYESLEKQDYFQPIYLFSGSATLEDDTVLEASLYLPAVSSEWLIQASPTPASKFKTE
jgi:hypothetical protein